MELTFEEVSGFEDTEKEFDIYEALQQYRDLTMEMSIYNNRLKELKKAITEHVKETGEIVEINGARIQVTAGYKRTTVQTKEFLQWCEEHPHSEAGKFVYEKEYAPGVRIKVGI